MDGNFFNTIWLNLTKRDDGRPANQSAKDFKKAEAKNTPTAVQELPEPLSTIGRNEPKGALSANREAPPAPSSNDSPPPTELSPAEAELAKKKPWLFRTTKFDFKKTVTEMEFLEAREKIRVYNLQAQLRQIKMLAFLREQEASKPLLKCFTSLLQAKIDRGSAPFKTVEDVPAMFCIAHIDVFELQNHKGMGSMKRWEYDCLTQPLLDYKPLFLAHMERIKRDYL